MCALSSGIERHIRHITSAQNARVKRLRALLEAPDKTGEEFAFEGDNLLAEGIRSGLPIETVFLSEERAGAGLPDDLHASVEVVSLPASLFRSVVTTEAPQGIAAIAARPAFRLEQVLAAPNPLILVAAAIQDPGNLGTLVRSAEAFSAAGVLLLAGTVSPWNQKALRASAGSTFRVPVIAINTAEFSSLRERGISIYAAVLDGASQAHLTPLHSPCAIVIGNEGAGISPDVVRFVDGLITIPCSGPVESLNAAVAGSILLYQASQSRMAAGR